MTIQFADDASAALNLTNWSDPASVWSTTGGLFACSTSSFRVLQTTTSAHAALADVLVSAVRASGANFDGCVIARGNISGATSNLGNCYFLNIFDANTLQFFRRIAGTNNQVGSNITATHGNGSKFGLKCTGVGATVTLTAYIDDIEVGTEPDTAGTRIVVAGQCGLVGFNSSSRYDLFSVDDLIDPGTFIDANLDTLAIAEQAAQVRLAKAIAAGVDALAISELAASVNLGASIGAGVDTLQIQEFQALLALQTRGYDIAKMFRYPSPLLRM